ncbi:MAG: hypothetical protein ACKPIH_24630 [Microcystis panniformis]
MTKFNLRGAVEELQRGKRQDVKPKKGKVTEIFTKGKPKELVGDIDALPNLRGTRKMGKSDKMDIDDAGHSSQVEPASNLRTAQRMGSGSGEETPISPFDFVQVGIPKTITTKLPYYTIKKDVSIATGTGSSSVLAYSWRMNSIYDIETSPAYTAIDPLAGPPSADTADATVNLPKWRTYFSNLYNYWTVLSVDYHIRIRCTTATADNGIFAVFLYRHGLQAPPTMDTATTPAVIPWEWKKLHAGAAWKLGGTQPINQIFGKTTQTWNLAPTPPVPTSNIDTTGNFAGESSRFKNNWVEFSGTYKPGTIDHDVIEDELQQVWHRMTEVPPTRECFTIHILRHPASDDTALTFQVEADFMYLTQFKDLKAIYQYPHTTTQILSTSQGAISQSN